MLKIDSVSVSHPNPNDREKMQSVRVYVSPKGETLMGNLFNRRNRPVEEFRTVVSTALEQVASEFSFSPEQMKEFAKKAKWSPYAGCSSCPCSPGFIIPGLYSRASVFIDVVSDQVANQG